ncbi:MAG: Rieske (2Fe-2S) protein [Pyrinomonadaceae bacterium]
MSSEAVPGTNSLTRRTFCNRVLLASTAMAIVTNDLKVEGAEHHGAQFGHPSMKIVGAEAVMPGSFLYFSYPTSRDAAVLLRAPDGEYFAYSRKCAHLGCSVDYDRARQCLTCPCHRGAYDAQTGFVLFGPPPRPLDQIVLQMRSGGQVWAVGKLIGDSNPNA